MRDHYDRLVPKCVSDQGIRDVPNATPDTWYQYGRTQALTAFINTPKLIVGVLSKEPMFQISTLHSFAWTLIQPYTKDIKDFLFTDLSQRIEEYEQKQATGRKNSQAYRDRAHKITAYRERREKLKDIKKFIYNPDGLNTEKNSLDHDEVLRICAAFLTTKQTFQDIVVDRFPVLLIDESQDTKKVLMDAFLTLEENHRGKFCLGLLGDVMQRIYLDGKERIQDCIPIEWAKPCKKMNHRSRKRIVTLCNLVLFPPSLWA